MKEEFRRNLPHFYSKDTVYDVTFRLANTIPKHILQKYNDLKEQIIKQGKKNHINNLYNSYVDTYLGCIDNSNNYLLINSIRKEVSSAIMYHDKKPCIIIAYCIMPNHVHLIINTNNFPYTPLGKILGSIKQFSAKKANHILGKKGQFWHHENFDHQIRSKNELAEGIEYIKNNPVNAKLVLDWNNWEGTFVNSNYLG